MSEPKSKKPLFLVLALLIIVIVFSVLVHEPASISNTSCSEDNMYVMQRDTKLSSTSNKRYLLEFAKTASQQELGLSGRPCLPKNGAMIFTFATDDKFSIWMKDMKFPLDVIWLDKDMKIVHIVKDMQPSSYPDTTYSPPTDARYVIELNKGEADTLGAQLGQKLNW